MSEQKFSTVELADIITPRIEAGGTSIIFQRHGKYNRDPSAEDAGSISRESAETMKEYDRELFKELMKQPDVYVLFASSDTQYAGKGYRSLETAQVAQDAAVEAMLSEDIDPLDRVINLNPHFNTARHDPTDRDIRPIAGIREPQIFHPGDKEYLESLQQKYGYADPDAKKGLSPQAWAMHEMDAEVDARMKTRAEGQEALINRTESSLALLERYAAIWHANNPNKRLVIWAASHYDTISPLVKKADGTLRDQDGRLSDAYQPVDYGGGVVINIPSDPGAEKTLERRDSKVSISFGRTAIGSGITRLNRPNY